MQNYDVAFTSVLDDGERWASPMASEAPYDRLPSEADVTVASKSHTAATAFDQAALSWASASSIEF